MLGLRCCTGSSLVVGSWGGQWSTLFAVRGLSHCSGFCCFGAWAQ